MYGVHHYISDDAMTLWSNWGRPFPGDRRHFSYAGLLLCPYMVWLCEEGQKYQFIVVWQGRREKERAPGQVAHVAMRQWFVWGLKDLF